MSALAFMLRDLFADPNLAVDGVFTAVGQAPVPVRVIRSSVTDRITGSIATVGSQAGSDTAEIQVIQVPDRPLKTATIQYDGRTRGIGSVAPARNGLTWVLSLTT